MRTRWLGLACIALAASCGGRTAREDSSAKAQTPAANGLRGVADFANISEPAERSKALFTEMGKVFTHPRCSNCHPQGDRPMQRDGLAHHPLVVRGEEGAGAPGMHCETCHGPSSFEEMPGAPSWHLAPAEMAWSGVSLGAICEQLKDPSRNGGRTLEEVVHHLENDALVAYGWSPPRHLAPAPGSQALLAELAEAWRTSGAHCP